MITKELFGLLNDGREVYKYTLRAGEYEAAVSEFGGETATDRSLIRLRHGARLARETQLPVLISGGRPLRAENSEAAVMAGILKNEFGIAVRWREEQSQDTAGNARYSAEILRQAGITRVVLVTQAFHMPRARLLFEAAGVQVVPAPRKMLSPSRTYSAAMRGTRSFSP